LLQNTNILFTLFDILLLFSSTSLHRAEACVMYWPCVLPQSWACVMLCYTGWPSHRQQCISTASAWPSTDRSSTCVCVLCYL